MPPNIIWIYCDELRTDALECYGNRYTRMHTANIDAIAAGGVLFENTFCNSAVCVSSRTSTLTGRYPEETGVYNNEAVRPHYQLNGSYKTFPEVFADHGYTTANFGKVHVPHGLDAWSYSDPQGGYMQPFYDGVSRDQLDIIHVPAFPYIVIGGRYPGNRPYPAASVTENALRWLENAPEPYFARLSYLQPHTPVLPPPPYDTLYADVKTFPDALEPNDHLSYFDRRYAEIIESDRLTPEQIRRIHIEYYGLVAWLDAQIGQVMTFLRECGQLENTIVVFEADHGTSLGEGKRLQKLTFAPEAHRVPRLMMWQGTLPAGQRRSDVGESLDIGRTLLEMAGFTAPDFLRGRNLFADDAPDAVYATTGYGYSSSRTFPSSARGALDELTGWPRRACVRTNRYRLDKNVRVNDKPPSPQQEDLFMVDVRFDPSESRNVAHDPAYRAARDVLLTLLDNHTASHYTPPESYVAGLEDLK